MKLVRARMLLNKVTHTVTGHRLNCKNEQSSYNTVASLPTFDFKEPQYLLAATDLYLVRSVGSDSPGALYKPCWASLIPGLE